MSLYSVSFTTKRIVTKYATDRSVISEDLIEVPVTLHGLPISTAQGYKGCDNFKMTQDFGRTAGLESKVSYRKTRGGKTTREVAITKPARSRKDLAAEKGDLGAALG